MPSNSIRILVGSAIILLFFMLGLGLDTMRGGDGLAGLLLFPGVIIGGGYIRSLSWAFIAGLIATLIAIFPLQMVFNPGLLGAVSNPNVAAVFVFFSLLYSGVAAVAGLATGFIARRRASKQKAAQGPGTAPS